MRALIAAFLFAAPTLAAPVPKELRKSGRLVGAWELTSMEQAGQVTTPAMIWRFENDRIDIRMKGDTGGPKSRTVFTRFDETTAPMEFDYDTAPEGPGRNILCIYEIRGDGLKLVMNYGDGGRPKELKAVGAAVLYVFKRVEE